MRLERDNEGTIAVFRTTVRQDQEKSGRVLRVNAAVVMDGRKSNDPSSCSDGSVSAREHACPFGKRK